MIYNADMIETLDGACDQSTISLAKKYASEIVVSLDQETIRLDDAEELEWSYNWYNKLQDEQVKSYIYDERVFCSVKYILYEVQDYLRESHIDLLEDNGLFGDFD